jgi:hypothetical protein
LFECEMLGDLSFFSDNLFYFIPHIHRIVRHEFDPQEDTVNQHFDADILQQLWEDLL